MASARFRRARWNGGGTSRIRSSARTTVRRAGVPVPKGPAIHAVTTSLSALLSLWPGLRRFVTSSHVFMPRRIDRLRPNLASTWRRKRRCFAPMTVSVRPACRQPLCYVPSPS